MFPWTRKKPSSGASSAPPRSRQRPTTSSKPTSLQVRVMGAFDLTPVNLLGRTSDPYATLTVARTKETHTTSTCLNTVNPAWYETMTFRNVRPSDVIHVRITDSNVVTVDKPIGTAQISVGAALSHATAVASEAAYRATPRHPQPTQFRFDQSAPPPEPNAPPPEPNAPPPEPNAPPFDDDVPPPGNHAPSYVPPPYVPPAQSHPYPDSTPAYPSAYPSPSEYQQYQPPPQSQQYQAPPPQPQQYRPPPQEHYQPPPPPPPPYQGGPPHPSRPPQAHVPNVSHHEDFSFEPPHVERVDAAMQRQMTMRYRVAPRGMITMIIAPPWLPHLEKGAPKKGFKRFQIHKLQDQVGKNTLSASLGKMIRTGAERAKPLQTALHTLEPIHAVFQEHSTWKITLLDVDAVFQGKRHSWNRDYPAARKIFEGHGSVVTRRMVQMQHAYLYGGGSQLKPVQSIRKELQEVTGNLIDGDDFLRLLEYGIRRGKPRLFTYVIMPNRLYLAETSAKFFRDMLSKHAMHCSASIEVVYAGELHFRRAPPGSSEPEFQLVVDNNSGTYAPSREDLPLVAEVFRRNFPGLHVVALDFQSPLLKQYVSELPPHHSQP